MRRSARSSARSFFFRARLSTWRSRSAHRVPEHDAFRKERLPFPQRPVESHADDLSKHAIEVARQQRREKGPIVLHESAARLEKIRHEERAARVVPRGIAYGVPAHRENHTGAVLTLRLKTRGG